MKAEDIKPRLNYIVVRRVESSNMTTGGITLPESVVKKENIAVEIVGVGPGTWSENGDRIPIELEVGQHALIHPTALFFEVPGMPNVAITADDAIVATVPIQEPVYEKVILT